MNNRRGMRGGKVWLFLSLSVLAAPASRVDAQPIVDDVDSIELMAADSTLVVRGTILAMRTEEKPPGYVWHTLAFGVDETLKGQHRPRREFVVLTNTVEKDLERWREQDRPLLVFLDESRCTVARWGRREYLRFPFAPRTGYPKGSFLELDPGARSRAYTMDLQPTTDPETILRATKTAIAAPGQAARLCVHQATPPNVGLVRVSVPMDGRLEEQARKWLASDDKDLRREGARGARLLPVRSQRRHPAASAERPRNLEPHSRGARSRPAGGADLRGPRRSGLHPRGLGIPRPPGPLS